MTKERITDAAIMRSDGILSLDKSHADIIKKSPYGTCKEGSDKGFWTSKYRYVDRIEALKIAIEAGQINSDMDTIRQAGLLSENLWADCEFKYSSKKGYYKEEKESYYVRSLIKNNFSKEKREYYEAIIEFKEAPSDLTSLNKYKKWLIYSKKNNDKQEYIDKIQQTIDNYDKKDIL